MVSGWLIFGDASLNFLADPAAQTPKAPALFGPTPLKRNENICFLLAVVLDPGRPQAGEAVLVDRELPGQEFVDR